MEKFSGSWVAFMISLPPFNVLQIAKHHVFFSI